MGRLVLPAGLGLLTFKAAGDWSILGLHKSPISGDPCIDLAVGGEWKGSCLPDLAECGPWC